MPTVILFDEPTVRAQLLPFTYTRPVAWIRCGILTVAEKWADWLKTETSYATQDYLQGLYPKVCSDDNLYIDGSLLPQKSLVVAIQELPLESVLRDEQSSRVIAVRTALPDWTPNQGVQAFEEHLYECYEEYQEYCALRNLADIIEENESQIVADYQMVTARRTSYPMNDPHTRCYFDDDIFLEEGGRIRAAILDTKEGPIYIGRNATVGDGSIIKGPFSLGEGAMVSEGAKIRPGTSIGPYCKVGGEVKNAVFFGYSNKSHDGYLGDSVIGEWCNLGANTNNSNLKNDYTNVKLYNYATQTLEDTGQTFCGLFMGDYTKAGISTMFNTGTVVGVAVNVFGAGFQPKHIPSFSWGGAAEGFAPYRFDKALDVIKETMRRRGEELGEGREAMLREINVGISDGAARAVRN